GELKHRLRALGLRDTIAAGTFHSLAYAQLRTWWSDRGDREPELLDRKFALVARQLPRRPGKPDVNVLDAISEIEWAKARGLSPEQYADAAGHADRRPPLPASQMGEVYRRYEDEKNRRNFVDFDDLLRLCERAFARDPQFADTQ